VNHTPDFEESKHRPMPGSELLWSMRTWVTGTCREVPVEAQIRAVLETIAAPPAADMLFGFMWAIGHGTLGKLTIASVCEPRIGPDERLLLDVLALYQDERNLEAMMLLRSILPPLAALAARDSAERLATILGASGPGLPCRGCRPCNTSPSLRTMPGRRRQGCIDRASVMKASVKPPDTSVSVPSLTPGAPARAVSSSDLLAGRRVLVIRHGPEEYRLQVTRSGRLLLTK